MTILLLYAMMLGQVVTGDPTVRLNTILKPGPGQNLTTGSNNVVLGFAPYRVYKIPAYILALSVTDRIPAGFAFCKKHLPGYILHEQDDLTTQSNEVWCSTDDAALAQLELRSVVRPLKTVVGWAGTWRTSGKDNGKIVVYVGPDAEAECARHYQDPVPVILKLDIEKQRKVRGKER